MFDVGRSKKALLCRYRVFFILAGTVEPIRILHRGGGFS
jgi:hypothetical protein